MKNSFSDILMAIPHCVVKIFECDNDDLVNPNSAKWGEYKGLIFVIFLARVFSKAPK